MRRLATIQTIKALEPIFKDGARTSLSVITFENIAWQCVGKTAEHNVGDKVLYIEISTVLPEHRVFEFMRPRKFKLQTARILGTVSQGLVMPVSVLAEFGFEDFNSLVDGQDVTDIVGVKRYEPEIDYKITGGGGFIPFPTHIVPKTDELRIQAAPFLLDEMKQYAHVQATVKLDGTSATYFWDEEKDEVAVCGRNIRKLGDDGSVYFHALRNQPPEFVEFMRKNPHLVFQGEICAPGIQKNRLGLKKPQFFVFNIFNAKTWKYIPASGANDICREIGVKEVPVAFWWDADQGPTFDNETIESLLEKAQGFYEGTTNHREGLVIRPIYYEGFSLRAGTRLSFKVINNDYLLKGGE